MRKVLVGGALLLASAGASAQSSFLTMYGVMDLYLGSAKSGSTSQFRMADGGNVASQLGFRGREDLGGGLAAIFTIEGGLNADDGSGTIPGPTYSFTRQAFAGLSSSTWGNVTAGRMYTPHFVSFYKASPFGINAVFSPMILQFQADGQTGLNANVSRANNLIRYQSPARLPVTLDLAFGPGEAATPSKTSGNVLSGSLSYAGGPLYVSYAFTQIKSGTAAAPAADPATSTHQTLSATYDFKVLKMAGTYGQTKSDLASVPKSKYMSLGAWVPMGPFLGLVEVTKRDVDGTDRDNLAYTIGLDFPLSKRTSLYGRFLSLNNKGNASVSLGQVPVVANSGDNSRLFGLGITHRF